MQRSWSIFLRLSKPVVLTSRFCMNWKSNAVGISDKVEEAVAAVEEEAAAEEVAVAEEAAVDMAEETVTTEIATTVMVVVADTDANLDILVMIKEDQIVMMGTEAEVVVDMAAVVAAADTIKETTDGNSVGLHL